MTDEIAAIIAEAFPAPAAASQASETAEATTPAPDAETAPEDAKAAPEDGEAQEGDDTTDEIKKLKGAVKWRDKKVSNRDQKIGSLQSELAATRQRLAALEGKQPPPAPREADFEGKPYEDLLTAKAEHAADKRFTERQVAEEQQRAVQVQAALVEERAAAMEENAGEAQKAFADFESVIQSGCTFKGADGVMRIPMPEHVKHAFGEADNGAYALYQILKDGALSELNGLSPAKAAMMIRDYEVKALETTKVKKVSSAPEPIATARGGAPSGKSLDSMSGHELYAWMKS